MSNTAIETLSDITVHMKYARYLPAKKRRETWDEIVERNRNMHIKKYPELTEEFVKTKKILPSMRSMQFGGKPIEISPNRVYNCAYMPIDSLLSFSEAMFLLLGGTGLDIQSNAIILSNYRKSFSLIPKENAGILLVILLKDGLIQLKSFWSVIPEIGVVVLFLIILILDQKEAY